MKNIYIYYLFVCIHIYQSINLYIDYKRYQTIVSINIEEKFIIEYPGIWLCFSNPYINLTEQKLMFINWQNYQFQKGFGQKQCIEILKDSTNSLSSEIGANFFSKPNIIVKTFISKSWDFIQIVKCISVQSYITVPLKSRKKDTLHYLVNFLQF